MADLLEQKILPSLEFRRGGREKHEGGILEIASRRSRTAAKVCLPHLCRNATNGSTLVAQRAGM